MSESAIFGASQTRDAGQGTKIAVDAIWAQVTALKQIRRRDGRIDDFDPHKLAHSIRAACEAAGVTQDALIRRITDNALSRLTRRYDGHTLASTEDLREIVGLTLIDHNLLHAAKRYLGYRLECRREDTEPVYGKGITLERFYTKPGVSPCDEIAWERRNATITNDKGTVVFEQKDVEIPKAYSQTATNIIVAQYFRGRLGTPGRETSVRQVVERVAKTIAGWGRNYGYFLTPADADAFEAELTSILVNQRAAFNSPVWYNVGVIPHPQCSACFIN